MESLQLKKVIFSPIEIVLLKKKGNITIGVEDIKRIEYKKPTLINYLLASTWFGGTYPGRLQVYLREKVGKTKLYLVKIKYKEFLKLPDVYRKIIDPTFN
jgi:hypothetical protein